MVKGQESNTSIFKSAEAILKAHFEGIISLRDQIPDIEGIHDIRVAIRRLRTALKNFSFLLKKIPLKKLDRGLKKIAADLGALRDEDVAIIALERLHEKAEIAEIKSGIEALIAARRKKRLEFLSEFDEGFDPGIFEGLGQHFEMLFDGDDESGPGLREMSFKGIGSKKIGRLLDEFCKMSESLYRPFEAAPLHKFRIAAKRLRYTIELFSGAFSPSFEAFAGEIALMQSALGDLHDCDIRIESLSGGLRKKGRKSLEAYEIQTMNWLLSQFLRQRARRYAEALELWGKWEREGFIEKLRKAIEIPSG